MEIIMLFKRCIYLYFFRSLHKKETSIYMPEGSFIIKNVNILIKRKCLRNSFKDICNTIIKHQILIKKIKKNICNKCFFFIWMCYFYFLNFRIKIIIITITEKYLKLHMWSISFWKSNRSSFSSCSSVRERREQKVGFIFLDFKFLQVLFEANFTEI